MKTVKNVLMLIAVSIVSYIAVKGSFAFNHWFWLNASDRLMQTLTIVSAVATSGILYISLPYLASLVKKEEEP